MRSYAAKLETLELEARAVNAAKLKSLLRPTYSFPITQAGGDKIVKNIVKKVGAHPLGVDEINFFRDDNTILHFKNPEGTQSLTEPMPLSRITRSSLQASPRLKRLRTYYLT